MSGPSAGSRGGPRKGRVQGCGRVWRSPTGRGRTRRGRYQPGLGLRVPELDRDRKRRPRREAQPAHGHSVAAAGRCPRPLCPRPCRRCSRAPGGRGGGRSTDTAATGCGTEERQTDTQDRAGLAIPGPPPRPAVRASPWPPQAIGPRPSRPPSPARPGGHSPLLPPRFQR